MNEQEIERAIDDLKDINKALKVQHMIRDMDGETTREDMKIYRSRFASVNLGIFTLKKQVPKKPIKKRFVISPDAEPLDCCPSCGNYLSNRHYKCCNDCGQKLDWSVEE